MKELQTIAKVLGLALGLSLLIKYGLATLPLPPDGRWALTIALLPTVVVAVWLTIAGGRATSHEE